MNERKPISQLTPSKLGVQRHKYFPPPPSPSATGFATQVPPLLQKFIPQATSI